MATSNKPCSRHPAQSSPGAGHGRRSPPASLLYKVPASPYRAPRCCQRYMSSRPLAHCAIVAMRQAPVKQSRGLSDAVPTLTLPTSVSLLCAWHGRTRSPSLRQQFSVHYVKGATVAFSSSARRTRDQPQGRLHRFVMHRRRTTGSCIFTS